MFVIVKPTTFKGELAVKFINLKNKQLDTRPFCRVKKPEDSHNPMAGLYRVFSTKRFTWALAYCHTPVGNRLDFKACWFFYPEGGNMTKVVMENIVQGKTVGDSEVVYDDYHEALADYKQLIVLTDFMEPVTMTAHVTVTGKVPTIQFTVKK